MTISNTTLRRRRSNPESQFRQFGMPQFVTTTGNADRRRHLEAIRRIREGIDPKPKTLGSFGGFAGVELSIPELDYAILKIRFPELNSRDAGERTRAWQRFARSEASLPYRLYRIKRGPQCRSITAR
jgi:hypothetical protein